MVRRIAKGKEAELRGEESPIVIWWRKKEKRKKNKL